MVDSAKIDFDWSAESVSHPNYEYHMSICGLPAAVDVSFI